MAVKHLTDLIPPVDPTPNYTELFSVVNPTTFHSSKENLIASIDSLKINSVKASQWVAESQSKRTNLLKEKSDKEKQKSSINQVLINRKDISYQKALEDSTTLARRIKEIETKLVDIRIQISKINQEKNKLKKDLSQLAGYINIDNKLAENFKKLKSGSMDNDLLKFYFNLFQNPFYVRYSLPELISDSYYHKGEIRELYEPFNFDKASNKKYYKAKVTKGVQWDSLRNEELISLFTKTPINPNPYVANDTVYSAPTDNVSLVEIKGPKPGTTYYWLRISDAILKTSPM